MVESKAERLAESDEVFQGDFDGEVFFLFVVYVVITFRSGRSAETTTDGIIAVFYPVPKSARKRQMPSPSEYFAARVEQQLVQIHFLR